MQGSTQMSYQANWEQVIKSVRYKPVKDEDEMMNIIMNIIYLNLGLAQSPVFFVYSVIKKTMSSKSEIQFDFLVTMI